MSTRCPHIQLAFKDKLLIVKKVKRQQISPFKVDRGIPRERLGGGISGLELWDLQLTLQHLGGEEFNRHWAAYRREKTEC